MKVEKAITATGKQSAVLFDDNYEIVEPVLIFTNWLLQKGSSPNTILSYVHDLKVFFEWLEKEGIPFYQVKPAYMPGFIKYVDEQGKKAGKKSAATINRHLAAVSSMYRHFEVLGGYSDLSPMVSYKGRRPVEMGRSFLVHTVNRAQVDYSYFRLKQKKKGNTRRVFPDKIEIFYNAIDELVYSDHVRTRNKLIFKILYESGFRVSEVLNLYVTDFSQPDVHAQIGTISVIDHGDNHPDRQIKTLERVIPVSMELIFALEDYLTNESRPYKEGVANVFVSDKTGEPLTRKTIDEFFQEVSNFTGIKITPHYLRHTHGTELGEFGYEKLYIQKRLGHKSVESTEKYIHLSLEASIRAYERFETNRKGAKL